MMYTLIQDRRIVARYVLAAMAYQKVHPPVMQNDRRNIGAESTVGLHVRRRCVQHPLEEPEFPVLANIEKDYGIYLGKVNDEFVVGIKEIYYPFKEAVGVPGAIVAVEVFTDKLKLRQEWEID